MRKRDVRIAHINVVGGAVVIGVQAAGDRYAGTSRCDHQMRVRNYTFGTGRFQIAGSVYWSGHHTAVGKAFLSQHTGSCPQVEVAQIPEHLKAGEFFERSIAGELTAEGRQLQPLQVQAMWIESYGGHQVHVADALGPLLEREVLPGDISRDFVVLIGIEFRRAVHYDTPVRPLRDVGEAAQFTDREFTLELKRSFPGRIL